MRDPKRIDRLLSLVKKIWKERPELRLMQLLRNATDDSINFDTYYLEDTPLEKMLIDLYCKKKEKKR